MLVSCGGVVFGAIANWGQPARNAHHRLCRCKDDYHVEFVRRKGTITQPLKSPLDGQPFKMCLVEALRFVYTSKVLTMCIFLKHHHHRTGNN